MKTLKKLFFLTASVTSFLSVLAWYPNTLLRTWCLVLHSLTLMTNMQLNGKFGWFSYVDSFSDVQMSVGSIKRLPEHSFCHVHAFILH